MEVIIIPKKRFEELVKETHTNLELEKFRLSGDTISKAALQIVHRKFACELGRFFNRVREE